MEVGIAVLAGIAIGWLIEWVIDWQYWRRGIAGFYATESTLRSEVAETEAELLHARDSLNQTKDLLTAARAQLQAAQVREAELQRRLEATSAPDAEPASSDPDIDGMPGTSEENNRKSQAASDKGDDLTRISGVSVTYVHRMHDAGVTTYSQIAMASAEELEAIVQPAAWQRIDFDEWKRQAEEFAAEPSTADEGEKA